MSVEWEGTFVEIWSLLRDFAVIGEGGSVVIICLIRYVCRKVKKNIFSEFYVTW